MPVPFVPRLQLQRKQERAAGRSGFDGDDEIDLLNVQASPSSPTIITTTQHQGQGQQKRLRRVKTANFPARVKRRISFEHLSAPMEGEEGEHEQDEKQGLGSAFQMA